MSNLDLQKNLQAKVSEKIRASFLDLIPEDAFDVMIAASMDEFLNGAVGKRETKQQVYVDGAYRNIMYNPRNDPDTLPGMIMQQVQATGKAKLLEILDQPEFKEMWTGCERQAGDAIKDMIMANAPLFVSSLFGGIVQAAVMRVGTELRNSNCVVNF